MTKAWNAFMARKSELCCNRYPLRARLKLFEATVSKSALYGCETWTMTSAHRQVLRTTQRRMLRWVLGKGRKVLPGRAENSTDSSDSSEYSDSTNEEPGSEVEEAEENLLQDGIEDFVSWIKRTTGAVEAELQSAQIEDWVVQQRRAYWRWAGHITRRTDHRWTTRVWNWIPSGGLRDSGHPKKRWVDDLKAHADSCVDPLERKRLHFMMRHCGQAVENGRGKFSVRRWREWWSSSEAAFVKDS